MKPSSLSKVILVIFALSAAVTRPSHAQSIDVPCDPAALVDAINTANANADADTLTLTADCIYTFDSANDSDTRNGDSALPRITTPVTINGSGATIERDSGATANFRLFFVTSDGDLTLNHLTVTGGNSGHEGGGIHNQGSLTVTGSTISNNRAFRSGGGILNRQGILTVTNSTISGNEASFGGGGLLNNGGTLTLVNSVISGNRAGSFGGGGLFNNAGTVTMMSSTLTGNSADDPGAGGIYSMSGIITAGSVEVTNSIIWGNSTQIVDDGRTITVTGSIVEGGYRGTGNLSDDPLFVDPIPHTDAPTSEGDYRLQPGSPAINAGSGDALPADAQDLDCNGDTEEPIPYDRDNTARIKGDTVDLGAYEWPMETDPDAEADSAGCER